MTAQASERTILVTGVNGQVGFELARSLQGLGRIVAVDRSTLDLSDLDNVRSVVRDVRPHLIVNPAAYTAVDKAESEPDLAMRINGEAPGVLAEEAQRLGAALIHYSTDYVFDGLGNAAYHESDPTNPQNVYGKSKFAGEQAISATGCRHLILRTSWVYGRRGKNFLLTMLKLGAERPELRVVADQIGAPTWARTIADVTGHIVAKLGADPATDRWQEQSGIYNLAAAGATSWAGFATAIFEISGLDPAPRVTPIPASDYPTPASRPANSRLSSQKLSQTFGIAAPDWRDALERCLAQ